MYRYIYIYMYMYLELYFPSTVGVLTSYNVLLSGITLPRGAHGPFILHPCLPGWTLILSPCFQDGRFFYFPDPRKDTYVTSLLPGRTLILLPCFQEGHLFYFPVPRKGTYTVTKDVATCAS
mgnify:CR=1 FL=1